MLYFQSNSLYVSMISKTRKNSELVKILFSNNICKDLYGHIKEAEKRKYSIIYHRFARRRHEGLGM